MSTSAFGPILATKLYIPQLRPNLVPRPQLIERLNGEVHRKLTLISAPAGFGKTTLVSGWIAGCKRPTAWLSLEAGDADPTHFLTYLVAAMQTLVLTQAEGSGSPMGERTLGLIQSPQPPPTETILAALLNEIATISDNSLLVLDDYHLLDSKPIDDALTFLLDHMPPQMHLVITTREDPNLPLARYRARGQLTEVRASDLRFTHAEASGFLNEMMGLDLSPDDIDALETRTEGWIAGLQLAALSIQGRADIGYGNVDRFIQEFTGSHRFVLDYLVEEVLQHQPEQVRNFLLKTAILDRLSGPLCDAVTGQEDGKETLATLEANNLFVIPLDNRRHWYRYHHLFAEVLQTRLREMQPDQGPILHRQASLWFEQNGLIADAIHHAFAAADFERAAGLLEQVWRLLDRSHQGATVLSWLEALPDELIRTRPVLCAGYAWTLLSIGKLEAAEPRLLDAERWLKTSGDLSEQPIPLSVETGIAGGLNGGMIVTNQEEFRRLPATIAGARAYLAQATGDIPGSIPYARKALALLPEGDHVERAIPAALLGLASWASGDLEAAHSAFTDVSAGFEIAGKIHQSIDISYVLADLRREQGRLHVAFRIYQQLLERVQEYNELDLPGPANLFVGLSELYREWGDLEAAKEQLRRSEELGEQAALPDWQHRLHIAKARIKEAEGDGDGALELFYAAERLYYRSPMPEVRPISASIARVWIAQGRFAETRKWADEQGFSVDDAPTYLREFEHITLARLLVAEQESAQNQEHFHQTCELLERLLHAAERGERKGSVIEILVLQALVYDTQGDTPSAIASLGRALALAEPEGYVRLFVDEGLQMARLLRAASEHQMMPRYTEKLLTAFGLEGNQSLELIDPKQPQSLQPLVEPMSQRELEILHLIAVGQKNQEIADELFISLNTVRYHTKNIYGKLGVNKRTQAVAKARELGIF